MKQQICSRLKNREERLHFWPCPGECADVWRGRWSCWKLSGSRGAGTGTASLPCGSSGGSLGSPDVKTLCYSPRTVIDSRHHTQEWMGTLKHDETSKPKQDHTSKHIDTHKSVIVKLVILMQCGLCICACLWLRKKLSHSLPPSLDHSHSWRNPF